MKTQSKRLVFNLADMYAVTKLISWLNSQFYWLLTGEVQFP